ncbi:GIP [Symbiodinium natans]|uniref:GIP protein n=1 Tax=Symbiodinium natans TaxID=878477 RepID=A0A812URD5_9DINO|nr:GIP [Symbiodinium natans]
MLWSKQKSPRFTEGKAANPIGPGSYELPSVWDDHATTMGGQDRFQEQAVPETPGPATYTQAGSSLKARRCKENRPPSRDRSKALPKEDLSELGKAKEQTSKKDQQLVAAHERLQVHEEDLKKVRQMLQDKDLALNDLRGEHDALKTLLEERSAEAEVAKRDACKQENLAADLSAQLQASQIDLEKTRAELLHKEEHVKLTADEMQQNGLDLQEARDSLAALRQDIQNKDLALNDLRGEHDALKTLLEERSAEAEVAKRDACKQESLAAELSAQLQASQIDLEKARAELLHKDLEVQDVDSRQRATTSELETCATALALAEAEKQEVHEKFAELRGQYFAAEQAQEASRELIEALRGELADLAASRSTLPEVEKLQDNLTAVNAELENALAVKESLRADLDRLKFAEINANMTKSAKDRAEAQVKELKLDVEHWRQKAQSLQRDEDRTKRQNQDISCLELEVKDLHQQNAQLLLTFQQFKAELDTALAENHSLQDTIDMYETNLQRATDQTAELMGHNNPKQKIRHMVNLKEENKELRDQLKKAKQRITQLGVSRKGEGLLEALASFSHSHGAGDQLSVPASPWAPETPAKGAETRTPKRPGTPTRKPASARGARSNPLEEEYQVRMVEEERRRQMQDRAVERVQTDFQHFIALIERAVLSEDRVEDSPNPAALLERLRAMASKQGLDITDVEPGANEHCQDEDESQ